MPPKVWLQCTRFGPSHAHDRSIQWEVGVMMLEKGMVLKSGMGIWTRRLSRVVKCEAVVANS